MIKLIGYTLAAASIGVILYGLLSIVMLLKVLHLL